MPIFRPADALAREHTEEAVQTLVDVMRSQESETKERLTAAQALLDRGHGKPSQAIIALPTSRKQAALLAALSDDELMEAIQGTVLPRLIRQDSRLPVDDAQDPLLD